MHIHTVHTWIESKLTILVFSYGNDLSLGLPESTSVGCIAVFGHIARLQDSTPAHSPTVSRQSLTRSSSPSLLESSAWSPTWQMDRPNPKRHQPDTCRPLDTGPWELFLLSNQPHLSDRLDEAEVATDPTQKPRKLQLHYEYPHDNTASVCSLKETVSCSVH